MPTSEPVEIDLSDEVPVRLRGHHFLCILTYRGVGYTPDFVENMSDIVDQIGRGRPVSLIEGPDDICNGLTAEGRKSCDHDCSRVATLEVDRLAIDAVKERIPLHSGKPFVLDAGHVALMRQGFADGSIRAACAQCPWNEFCTGVAADGFAGARLFPPA